MWLPPPRQCSVGSLSLEFASRETDGLLLYGGPTSPVREGDVHDFIAVELTGGKIRVSISLGDRNDVVRVGVTGGVALDDGEWHHVEVYRNGTVQNLDIKYLVILVLAKITVKLKESSVWFTKFSENQTDHKRKHLLFSYHSRSYRNSNVDAVRGLHDELRVSALRRTLKVSVTPNVMLDNF